jgi:anti-sigma factor (TIGR02949 family)
MTKPHAHDDGAPIKDCSGAMNKLFDLLDGELTAERAKEVQSHIFSCPDCFTHSDFEQRFIAAVKEAKPQICASSALKEKLMSALRSAGFSSR